MLTRSAALLGIQRGVILELAKSALPHRRFSVDVSPKSEVASDLGSSQEPKQYTVEDFGEMIKTEEEKKKCHLILLEIASIRDDTGRAPTEIRNRDIEDLLKQSVHQRRKYYDYMFKREITIKSAAEKKARARAIRESEIRIPKEAPDGLFPFIRRQQMFRCVEGKRLMEAALFGQKIIFDFSYEDEMTNREKRNLAEQIQLCYAVNRLHHAPFDFTFCNLEKDGFMEGLLYQYFQAEDLGTMLLGCTEKSYLDLYPKKDLVYLTPDSPYTLREWDHSSIFIIGGLVDLGCEKPLTLAKAKKEGIATARFPLQEYVILKQGAQKTLTLNNVVDILLTMKTENDWQIALSKLPKRFLAAPGQSRALTRRIQSSRNRRDHFAELL